MSEELWAVALGRLEFSGYLCLRQAGDVSHFSSSLWDSAFCSWQAGFDQMLQFKVSPRRKRSTGLKSSGNN